MTSDLPPVPPTTTQIDPFDQLQSPLNRSTLHCPHSAAAYVGSDWEILNRATPHQLDRLRADGSIDLPFIKRLLSSYRTVYLPVLMQLRAQGYRGCPSPTPTQLQQMSEQLGLADSMSADQVLFELRALAQKLRSLMGTSSGQRLN